MAISRLALLALLWFITGGREISNDTSLHMEMVRSPFFMFTGNENPDLFPPLLPLMEAWLAYPLQTFLPDFLALRLTFIFYEVLLAAMFYRATDQLGFDMARKGWCLIAFLALPMGWMTSTVMAQDEVIASCLTLLPILVTIGGWPIAGLALASFGVLAGKIFITLVLLVLFVACREGSLTLRILAACGPLVLVYVPISVMRWMHRQPPPLLGLRPDPYFGTNFWILLKHYFGLNLEMAGPYSGVLALWAALIPVSMLWRAGRIPRPKVALIVAVNCTLMMFLALFFNVLAEYFMIVVPLLILTAAGIWDVAACAAVATMPWAIRFFQNAVSMHKANETPGKFVVLKYYQMIFRTSPEPWLVASEALFSVVMIGIAVMWCRRLRNLLLLTSLP
jgi:hypothetical protein